MEYRVLGRTGLKISEIGVGAWQLLGRLDLAGKIVLSGAAHTQVETGRQILFEQGGDYLMTVKANQQTLQATLQNLFEKQAFSPSDPAAPKSVAARAQSESVGNPLSPILP